MIADYPELIAEVSHRSKRSDVVNRAAMYVGLAERMLSKRLRLSEMLAEVEATTDSSGLADLPDGYQEMKTVTVHDCELRRRPLNLILTKAKAGYAIQARKIKSSFRSTPHQLVYFGAVPSLEANNTTWLLDLEPELYIQAVLFQIYTGNNEIEQAQATAGYLSGLIDDANDADAAARHSGTVVSLGGNTP
ncbi:MAG: hypothetical protein JJ979_05770 [Roseibium sp.]|nr:hypothetical protein [Roseibium sp.]